MKNTAERWMEARECLESIHALPIEHDEKGHAFKRIACRSMSDLGSWLGEVVVKLKIGNAPPEVEHWKSKYIEARKETKTLADALEFIRDCTDDEDEGVTVSVPFLQEQARTVLYEVQP